MTHLSELTRQDEQRVVVAWAARMFTDLGFPPKVAFQLADIGADWHQARDLLSKGCSHELAANILT